MQCFEDCEPERPSVTCIPTTGSRAVRIKGSSALQKVSKRIAKKLSTSSKVFPHKLRWQTGAMTRTVSWPMQFQWVWKLSFLKKEPQRITRIRQISLYTAPSGLEVFSSLETLKSHCHSLRKNFKCFSRCGTGSLYRCLDCCSILLL